MLHINLSRSERTKEPAPGLPSPVLSQCETNRVGLHDAAICFPRIRLSEWWRSKVANQITRSCAAHPENSDFYAMTISFRGGDCSPQKEHRYAESKTSPIRPRTRPNISPKTQSEKPRNTIHYLNNTFCLRGHNLCLNHIPFVRLRVLSYQIFTRAHKANFTGLRERKEKQYEEVAFTLCGKTCNLAPGQQHLHRRTPEFLLTQ
jgi:hypothetical protein